MEADIDPLLILALLAALAIGAALGWMFAGRASTTLRAERDATDARFRQAIADLADAVERRHAAERDLAGLRAGEEERARGYEARLTELREAKEALTAQFAEVGGKLLGEAQKAFLERADQRFAQAGEQGEAKLKALLTPVQDTLKRYEDNLGRVEKEREGSYRALGEAVAQLAQGNVGVVRETQRLANVMRSSPKARGRWGEEQLKTILTGAGLAENIDFTMQASINDGERQLRPDCVVSLPNGRCIVIDVKNVWSAFEQAFDEEDEGRRGDLLKQHVDAMRATASDLGRKGYWKQFAQSPEFVIMFVPGEHFLSAAAERAPDLIEAAYRNGVVIASTINMLALAKVIAGIWRQEALATQAKDIAEAGQELYRRLAAMGGHVEKLGRNLAQATGAYNSFVGSLETKVLTQARRFETLKVNGGTSPITTPPVIETGIRPLTKLSAAPAPDDGEGSVEAAE